MGKFHFSHVIKGVFSWKILVITLYIKNTFSGEVTGSCWLFSSHFSYAWIEMKNQLLTFPNKSITLQQLSTL